MPLKLFVLLLTMAIFSTAPALARDITLAWDENSESDIAGYRLYYKAGSSSLPLDGVGAAEGASPVDVQDNVVATLTDLPDGQIYYFAVTAYNTAGQESPLSEMVVSDWVPELYFPLPDELVSPAEVTFSWEGGLSGDGMTYTLHYGTDPNLESQDALAFTTSQTQAMLAGGAFMGLIAFALAPSRRMKSVMLMALLIAPMLVNGCGSGGGDGGGPVPIEEIGDGVSSPSSDEDFAALETVTGLTNAYHIASDLEPSAVYYWKVFGTDAQGRTFESVRGSFMTEAE